MHILIIPNSYPTDFDPVIGTFFQQQAYALKSAGYKVGVVVPQYRSLRKLKVNNLLRWPRGESYHIEKGIPVYQYHSWSWFSLIKFLRRRFWVETGLKLFQKYINDYGKPDIVHAHVAWLAGDLAFLIRQYYNIPYVLTEHSSAYARGLMNKRQIHWVKKIFQQADKRIVVSPELGKLLESLLGEAIVSPWIWIPNIVESRFRPVNKSTSGAFYRFLNIAIMKENKGQEDLLRAFAARFKGNEAVQLRFGGDGPLEKTLKQLSVKLGIAKQVSFLGRLTRDEVVSEMQSCDAFVLPSHYETFGVVLIEALACGKPVVATACGGPESIVNANNGILVPPRDIIALGDALVRMFETSDNYVAENIYQDCLSRFGEQAVVSQLSDIYKEIVVD